jgi:hypothetical protein
VSPKRWYAPILFYFLFIYSLFSTPFQFLRQNSVGVGSKPAASAQFLLNPDLSARDRAN